jgi:exo-beta-1,3-glucanase (GH17 family)
MKTKYFMTEQELIANLDKVHTTALGEERIRRNLCQNVDDIVDWCRQKIQDNRSSIIRKGKNCYVGTGDYIITVNAHSYTIITAHKL